jgi:hypothetical protein
VRGERLTLSGGGVERESVSLVDDHPVAIILEFEAVADVGGPGGVSSWSSTTWSSVEARPQDDRKTRGRERNKMNVPLGVMGSS